MRAALLTEYRKLVTTRLWWVLLVAMALVMVFMGASLAFTFSVPADQGGMGGGEGLPALTPTDVALSVYSVAAGFGYVFPVVVGALAVTGELRHMTITPTLLAEPRRGVVLGAKLLAALPVGLLFGLVGTAATVAGGATVLTLTGGETALGEPEVLRGLALSVLALGLWAVLGVGFGTVLTNQVAAVVVVLAYNQLVEPLLRLFLGSLEWGQPVTRFLPGAAAEALVGSSIYTAVGAGDLLEWWQGGLVLAAYALVLAAIGRATTFRRDIT
ncbi:ABC transporter permease [Cellulomonas carbonis]|uniref:ABC transporter permease n=1 Tax=Cellulomonas carbonis T26 TaxID=947969 RepID=A0A0A0BTB5_9CELL|nr:ABC transporter permease [Cellulomonas carbonis]KGM10404.1 ABC transporter permease [Cellulomonas carbonis T26]GGC11782.1 hypothetical protein GCM10010972_26360 [Cellulomonas carbonis]